MVDLSEFEEMYLKRIYEIYDLEPSTIVKTSQLAKIMEVTNASTTEMIQRLSDRDLLTYIPYKVVSNSGGIQNCSTNKEERGTIADSSVRGSWI